MNKPCGEPLLHDPHAHGDLEWCDGDGTEALEKALLADLAQGEAENVHVRACRACDALEDMSESVRDAAKRALAGTIGRDKLDTILSRHGYNVGRRAIERHRQEGH